MDHVQDVNRFGVVVDVLHQRCDLQLHPEDLVAERVQTHLLGELQRLAVVFEGILGLNVDVGVEEGAAELHRDGFRVGFEVVDDVDFVNVVDIDEPADSA